MSNNSELKFTFSIMWKNEKTTDVYISDDRKNVKIIKYTDFPGKQPFIGGKIDIYRIYEFLKSRCYEDGYKYLDKVLKNANMTSNDPWEWCRYSNGLTWDDHLWIRYPGEEHLDWEDLRVR